jgi:hypothetical protein
MIDHHAVGTPYCDHLVDGGAAAAGEMVFRIAKRTVERGHLSELPHGVVEACFTALSSDTGCFRFSNTTARVHLAAAEMMEAYPEMDTAAINHSLFDSKSLSALRAEAFAGANLETALDGKVAFLTVSALDRADFDLNEEDFETAIDVVRSLRGAIVAFTVKENRDGKFKADFKFMEQQPENIRSGQTYYLNLQLGQPVEAVLIPRGAFYQKTGGKWIYVLSSDGSKATRRDIKIGRQNPQYYEVVEGLEAGERVITSSYDNFGESEVLVF